VVAVASAIAACTGGGSKPSAGRTGQVTGGTGPPGATRVCGQPVLLSPWHYDGTAGTYTASNAPRGLPTFGSPKTDFPSAREIIVVPPGNNTVAAERADYQVNNAVVYFEPGVHAIENVMYTGHNTAYVGGYSASHGKAVVNGVDGATDGTGMGGERPAYSQASSGNNVYDTWEYLTIENYTSSLNNSVMGNVNGGGFDIGDTYKFNTIGPNQYGYSGSSTAPRTGQSSGGGYAIDAGSYTTIEYNCLTGNAQGAFNVTDAADLDISNNEISWNGLGVYPDTGGSGGSPFSCGCSGGGKIFSSLNASFTGNYVHDNYNNGVWFDVNNAGANISHNYISGNWGSGIFYEASYNASITGNTLVGNGWASSHPWPAGVHGGSCGGVSCANGFGPVTGAGGGNPYAAIDLSNSGGNSELRTRYAGSLLVAGNVVVNNFGGVKVYTDTNRYPGNIDDDSACSLPLGPLHETGASAYYKQGKVLVTGADTAISGQTVTTAGGTTTICAAYGKSVDAGSAAEAVAPSVGMAVFDEASGAFLGTVASVRSARAFTLSRSPGNSRHASLLLSAYGGCGPADYFGGGRGIASGQPKADYWDNCIWGSRNVAVKGNTFSIDERAVHGCEVLANLCGYMTAMAFNAGVPRLMRFWSAYPSYIALAAGGLGNVWSGNHYQWAGPDGGWRFQAGSQGNTVPQAQWQHAPYRQDAGSTFKSGTA
jgi:hypothetical protein